LRHVRLDDLGFTTLAFGQVRAARLGVGVGGLQAALALALEHGRLVEGPVFRFLLGLLQLGRNQPECSYANRVARLQGVNGVSLQAIEQGYGFILDDAARAAATTPGKERSA